MKPRVSPPPESHGVGVSTPPQPPEKLTVWKQIVQRYRWMSFWNRMALWAFLALLICTAVGFQYVVPAYRHVKSRMFLKMANQFMEEEDYDSASVSFRKAILSGNSDPFVWRNVAAFLEKIRSPEIGNVWETLAELEPDVPEHKIRQADAMLELGRTYQTSEILRKLPESVKETVGFHEVSANLAIAKRDYQVAAKHFEAWHRLEPQNQEVPFQLLVTKIYSSDPDVANPAVEQLEQIAGSGGPSSAQAYRALIARSVQAGDTFDAARLAGRLVDLPNPTFNDMAGFLNLEIVTKSSALPRAYERFLNFAEADPTQLPDVANFLLGLGQVDTVRDWLKKLPDSINEHPDAIYTRFQVALSTKDWATAFNLLRENNLLFEISLPVMELAERAFAEREAGDKTADQTWQQIIYAVQGNQRALQILSLMAEARNWPLALGRTLSALTNLAPGNLEFWRRLARHEALMGNLAGYHSALTGMLQVNRYDIVVASEWSMTSVLLRKEDPNVVLETARRAYESTNPVSPRVAISYAIALISLKQNKEAVEVIDKISVADRSAPGRAMYVGAVLASVGRHEEALSYFKTSEDARHVRFIEELGFRRIWKGIAMGEESAENQLKKILEQHIGWQDDSNRIALDMQREIDLRYEPVQSQKILHELRLQAQQQQPTSAELQKLVHDLKSETAAPE